MCPPRFAGGGAVDAGDTGFKVVREAVAQCLAHFAAFDLSSAIVCPAQWTLRIVGAIVARFVESVRLFCSPG